MREPYHRKFLQDNIKDMKSKIVFIINSITQPRCLKRVQEFIDHGYEVAVYGFERKGNDIARNTAFPTISLGVIDNRTPYIKRIRQITTALRPVFRKYDNEDVLYYLFNLDMCLCSLPWVGRKYIYEESDLVHVYCGRRWFEVIMERLCKLAIRRSYISVFTSEGFVEYHFPEKRPSNIHVITNRVNTKVKDLPEVDKSPLSKDKLSIGFVGIIRYKSVVNLCRMFLEQNPNNEFHFFGTVTEPEWFYPLKEYSGCHFHGTYKNPDDLPEIYSKINLVVSTYDANFVNARYLEPNKLYEAIYFETPIIVSTGTFLAKRVKELNVGFEVDALDEKDILRLLSELTIANISKKIESARQIGKEFALNNNESFFVKLNELR